MARAIRRLSGRRARGYEAINCADFTPELLRSERFALERGAFTGAVGKKEGLFPRVEGGTVFLDEIGELPPLAQSMLLRFLQSGEGRAVGATGSTRVDLRVIAATHRDLEVAVAEHPLERGQLAVDGGVRGLLGLAGGHVGGDPVRREGAGPHPAEVLLEVLQRASLAVKRTGKRRTGNPFAPFEVAGAGTGLTATLHGHEAGNGGYSQGEPAGHRASPRPHYPHRGWAEGVRPGEESDRFLTRRARRSRIDSN